MEDAKEEILRRFKGHGWHNTELFEVGREYGIATLNIRVDYFMNSERNMFITSNKRIIWTEENSKQYEYWFFNMIEDIMYEHKLMRHNFKFIRHWKN